MSFRQKKLTAVIFLLEIGNYILNETNQILLSAMNELFKYYAFIFLALRVLLDLAASVIIYYQTETLGAGIGSLLVCSIFPLFLYFGIKNEKFRGRYGRRVCLSSEPFAYWFVVVFLVLFHLIMTALMISIIHW